MVMRHSMGPGWVMEWVDGQKIKEALPSGGDTAELKPQGQS